MKKMFFTLAMMLTASGVFAFNSNFTSFVKDSVEINSVEAALPNETLEESGTSVIPEPEFINSYCIVTSDNSLAVLPKENGRIGKHKNKASSILGTIGKVANVVSAVGGLGMAVGVNVGNVDALLAGAKASSTALNIGNVAETASSLTSANGMDIIFAGKHSSYVHPMNGEDIRILIKAENNDYDPHGMYRIVKFNTSKKERRIQWLEFDYAAIDATAKKKGYIPFSAKKHGEQSYMLTIPAAEIEEGEYGIIFMGIEMATYIPIGTFSIQ